ncbi:MAG TPA: sulfite exporter TauE/SafE family protein [Solirubrobacteraceae bacterium]|nr:sulfite exporter TauE/SafE family protein [Solirubrobacteraceae bacterium]
MIEAALIGALAGVIAGMLGVGGGILFVPALVLVLGLTQHEAEATSLVAIVPVAFVGAWRQARYGNLALRDGIVLGVLAVPGSIAGVALANVAPERVLRLAFAGLIVFIAAHLARENLGAATDDRERPPARDAGL